MLKSKPFVPALEYRQIEEVSFAGATNASVDLLVHFGLNRGAGLDEAHGGTVTMGPWGQTAFELVPPKVYNNSKNKTNFHPEWYTGGQLCYNAPGLKEFLAQRVAEIFRAQPSVTMAMIAQEDNGDYCKRGDDLVQTEANGSPMAPMLQAVNYVADSIKEEFPQHQIGTLAYAYTQPAPSITRPRENVVVEIAPIGCNYGAAFTDKSNAAFQKDIARWHAISGTKC